MELNHKYRIKGWWKLDDSRCIHIVLKGKLGVTLDQWPAILEFLKSQNVTPAEVVTEKEYELIDCDEIMLATYGG